MSEPVVVDRKSALILAGATLVGCLAVGVGAFFGGWALGERSTPEPPTVADAPAESAEKEYTTDDLEAAVAECGLGAEARSELSLVLPAGDFTGRDRSCVLLAMGASPRAMADWETVNQPQISKGEWSWSNVHMEWEQTPNGRDLTITVQ